MMWNKWELEWLEKNKELINKEDTSELRNVLPSDKHSRSKIMIMVTLLKPEGEFSVLVNTKDKKMADGLGYFSFYTNLFRLKGMTPDILTPLDSSFFPIKEANEKGIENHLIKMLKSYEIPERCIKEILSRTTAGID